MAPTKVGAEIPSGKGLYCHVANGAWQSSMECCDKLKLTKPRERRNREPRNGLQTAESRKVCSRFPGWRSPESGCVHSAPQQCERFWRPWPLLEGKVTELSGQAGDLIGQLGIPLALMQRMASSTPTLNYLAAQLSLATEDAGIERLDPVHVPGSANVVPDFLSRPSADLKKPFLPPFQLLIG